MARQHMAAAGEMATPNLQAPPPPFSAVHVNWPLAAANRLMAAVHAVLVAAVVVQRALQLVSSAASGDAAAAFRHAAMALADLTLLFLWVLSQSGLWRPVSRAVFPDKLLAARRRGELPGVDVLVVTADPDKEPALGVMNTVVSAMALDYPGWRLSVFLSDDAGSPLTLLAARRAYAFARAWVPFCRKHSVRCPSPDRYFARDDDGQEDIIRGGDEAAAAEDERLRIKKMYETFKGDIEEACRKDKMRKWTKENRQDHDAHVEVINDDAEHEDEEEDDERRMPLLVYVSREKRRASPHHFKAGALNALLRVSALLSNAPYVLVLDCDMSCNSRASALEAVCLHLDRSPPAPEKLGFVQFPQMFHNLSEDDIYTNGLRFVFATRWFGLDGLRGPGLSGTGFYARRDALYGAAPVATSSPTQEFRSMEANELATRFGHSDHLVASVRNLHQQQQPSSESRLRLPRDAKLVASSAYERRTGWGDQVGFNYQSVVEDYFTGYRRFFCPGWTSAYCYPAPSARPPFLGSMPTNLNDVLVQNKRWMSGLLAVGLSRRYCPLACRELLALSVPQAMIFAYFGFIALYAFPVLCYAILPQLCFFRGVPLFPATPWFAASFASSLLQHLVEVSVARHGLAMRAWWNEQRFWMLNAVTGQLFGCISAFQDLLGAESIHFDLTNKADDDGSLYHKGVFDFTGCSTLLLPATTLCVLNAAALVGGIWKMMARGAGLSGELFPQLFLLSYVAALSYPLLEGLFLRQDPARVPGRITALSVAVAAVLLALFG